MLINVSGKGFAKMRPEAISLSFLFRVRNDDYKQSIIEGAKTVEEFNNMLVNLEDNIILKENIHSNGFHIKELTKKIATGEKDGYGREIMKDVFDCFLYTQEVHVEIDFNLTFLEKVLLNLSTVENVPNCDIKFKVKDFESLKDLALADAYEKCKRKAEILAKAAGVEIEECKSIDYNIPTHSTAYAFKNCESSFEEATNCVKEHINLDNILNPDDIFAYADIVCSFKCDD